MSSLKQQANLERFLGLLEGRVLDRSDPAFTAAVEFLKTLPDKMAKDDEQRLRRQICITFQLTPLDLDAAVAVVTPPPQTYEEVRKEIDDDTLALQIEKDLDTLVPRTGFVRRYVEFTKNCEPPLAYHIFIALSGIAAVVNRRVRLGMGYFNIFPPLGCIILGPSGIKKTSATDIMVSMVQETQLVKVYSEKLTPEALIEAMGGDNATGLLYAPEMAAFLSRQKYMEGIVPLITRFMDCPDVWESGTIMRGNRVLRNIAISCLMCSTPDWFISNTPEDMFGGGFIARNLLVVQYHSPRIFPVPSPPDKSERQRLIEYLAQIHSLQGDMTLSESAMKCYVDWYTLSKKEHKNPEHELLATYYQRKPTHTLRIAMTLHLARCGDLELCQRCFEDACNLLKYIERFLPMLLEQMFKSKSGEETDLVVRKIRSKGGVIGHSELIQRLQYKLDAGRVRQIISDLKEAGYIEEFKLGAIGARTYRWIGGLNG